MSSVLRLLSAIVITGCIFATAVGSALPAQSEDEEVDWTQFVQRTTLDGRRLHYVLHPQRDVEATAAHGPAIVLVPGWASNSWAWHKQSLTLSDIGLPVISFAPPGSGSSQAPPDPLTTYTLDFLVDGVKKVLDHSGHQRAIVMGHSNGAAVAQRFYRRFPEKTAAIVSIDGALQPLLEQATVEQMVEPLRSDSWREFVTQMIGSMQTSALTEDERQGLVTMATHYGPEILVATALTAADPQMWGDEPITVPVLAIKAKQPTWSAAYEAEVRALAPKLDYRVWEGVGHFIQLERPDELEAALREFLVDYEFIEGNPN